MDNSPAWDDPLAATPEASHRAPRPPRRRDGVGEAAAVDEGVSPLPRHRDAAAGSGVGHRAPGARQPVRGRGPGVHRDHRPCRIRSCRDRGRRRGRTGATWCASPHRRAPASPDCGTTRSAGSWPTTPRRTSTTGPPTASGLVGLYGTLSTSRTRTACTTACKGWSEHVQYSVRPPIPTDTSFDPDPLLARAGLGARELAYRRRPEALRDDSPRPTTCGAETRALVNRASPSTTTRATAPASAARASRGAPRSRSTGCARPGYRYSLSDSSSARTRRPSRSAAHRASTPPSWIATIANVIGVRYHWYLPMKSAKSLQRLAQQVGEEIDVVTFAMVPSAASGKNTRNRMRGRAGHRGHESCGVQATRGYEKRLEERSAWARCATFGPSLRSPHRNAALP